MSDIAQQALSALLAGGKGAAAGMALGPVGAAAGGLIGLASSLVPHIFGDDAKPALAAVAQAITGVTDEARQVQILSTDPAAVAQFKVQALQIAADREAAQITAQTDELTARLADVANARQQTVQLAQAGSKMSWGAPVISLVVVVGLFGALAALLYVGEIQDSGVSAMINMIVGGLVAGFASVLGFWLGSSSGSARKTELLANSVPGHLMDKPLETQGADR